MNYEIIREIKNSCGNNQMRDVFFTEEEIDDTDAWIRSREPHASSIQKETTPHGLRFFVDAHGLITEYNLTEAD